MLLYAFADAVLHSSLPLEDLLLRKRNAVEFPDFSFEHLAPWPGLIWDDWSHIWRTESGMPTLCLAKIGADYWLRFPELADFLVTNAVEQISAWRYSETNDETLRHLLLDQVLPRLLAHKGRLVLHASTVQVAGRAIAFIGETGSGKSTLAASFHAASHPLLSDDGLVLRSGEGFALALPTYSSLRLWPDGLSGLFPQMPDLAPMAHYSAKQRVTMRDGANMANQPLPLAALYTLAPETETGGVAITRLSARDACMAIIHNAFQLDPTDQAGAAGLLDAASAVARRVPAFTLSYPREFASLPAMRAAILNQQALWAVCDGNDLDKG